MLSDATGLSDLCVGPGSDLREAIEQIDRNRRGVVVVVDAERRLTDVLTDGDVRRAILKGTALDTPVTALRARRRSSPYAAPLAAPKDLEAPRLLEIMRRRGIRHLPLLDENDRVAGLVTLEDLLPPQPLPVQAIIMAGGLGTRLRPLTETLPKPMLPVGDRPLLEHMIGRLRDSGISCVHITTHYKPEVITRHFGDGAGFGVELRYLGERDALGTAGALALLEKPRDPLLVLNGDVLTTVDFRAMLTFHQEQAADLTVATRRWDVQVPYGVVECRGTVVRRLLEKPQYRFLVNAGVYLVQPTALALVPPGRAFHMTDLIARLLEERRRVVGFPIHEYWIDIGRRPDYDQAQRDFQHGRFPG